MDLAGFAHESFLRLSNSLGDLLEGFEIVAVVPVSAQSGDNVARPSARMPWHTGGTLREAIARFRPEVCPTALPLRFPVQGARTRDDGSVLAFGRIESGRITRGDSIVFCPSGICTKVTAIVYGDNDSVDAAAGQSIGIVLADGLLPPPGEVVCHRGAPITSARRFLATVFWLSESPLREGMRLTIRSASQVADCKVTCIRMAGAAPLAKRGEVSLSDGDMGSVEIRSEWPLALERFCDVPQLGRLALSVEGALVGAGVVEALAGTSGRTD
jgi:sulfate adenylyltransferase subunit 1 (EFTu-like GTPase family)